ncbi:hypothetical protein [Amycolatopsis sulphurea]|uniref:hypothetical protein n=1 Tax=Amycolatopsis sulphurea TaxID=76022 RepID=UPI001FED21E4|nr:hypothetical protein [Amycolatopsis sulphurea]
MAAPAEHAAGEFERSLLQVFFDLPEPGLPGVRIEAVDGAYHLSPAPTSLHQRILQKL